MRHWIWFLILAAVANAATHSGNKPKNVDLPMPEAELEQAAEPDACEAYLVWLNHHNYQYAWMSVPETDAKDAPTVRVFFAYPRDLKTTKKIPLCYFSSAPGITAYDQARQVDQLSKKFAPIYMDPRGTGCSSRYPNVEADHSLLNATKYLSRAIAGDAEKVRAAVLGDKKWAILGQDSGGLAAQRYIAEYPSHVEAAYLIGSNIEKDRAQIPRQRIQAQKRVVDNFFKEHPDVKDYVKKLSDSLDPRACVNVGFTSVCGRNLLNLVGLGMNYASARPGIYKLFAHLKTLKMEDAQTELVRTIVGVPQEMGLNGPRITMNILANRIEAIVPDPHGSTSLRLAYDKAFAEEKVERGSRDWLLGDETSFHSVLSGSLAHAADDLLVEPDPLDFDRVVGNLRSTQIPAYFIFGDTDVSSPAEATQDIRAAAKADANLHVVDYKGGHESLENPAVVKAILAK